MKLLSFSALALLSSFALASVGCAAPTDTAAPAAEEGTDSADVVSSQDIRASSNKQLQRVSNPKPLLVNNTPDDISPHYAPCAGPRHFRPSGTT
jgi:hypothetical protein